MSRSLLTHSPIILVSLPFDAEYFQQILRGMLDARHCAGDTFFRVVRWQGCQDLIDRIRQVRAAGGYLRGVIAGMMSPSDLTMLRRVWRGPLVNVSARTTLHNVPSVIPDNEAVGRLAFEHLHQRGHRRFGFVGRRSLQYSLQRQSGFERAAAERAMAVEVHEWTEPASLKMWLEGLVHPVGILAAQDAMAFDVISAAIQVGRRVPEEVAVVVVDNATISCELAQVPLSSVDMDGPRIGRTAVELMVKLMDGQAPPAEPLRVPPLHLVVRRSSNQWAVQPPELAQALAFIERRACDRITVGDILAAVPIARRTLERELSRRFGRTPMQQIRHIQLQRAARLLESTSFKLLVIARQCGFLNARHFATTFGKAFGCTPQAYRRRRAAGAEG